MSAARDDLAARGVRVKQLVWVQDPDIAYWLTDGDGYGINNFRGGYEMDGEIYPTLPAAKAAAQADYEARILAALEVPPAALSAHPAVRALVEAERDRLRADAQAAAALVVEQAAQAADCGCKADQSDCLFMSGDVTFCYREGLPDIRALAPADGLAAVEALRKELADTQTQLGDWIVRADEANVKAEKADAELTAAQQREAGLKRELDDAVMFLDNAVSKAPEPLRELGGWLANKLDEDEWPTAERLLNAAVKSCAAAQQREEGLVKHGTTILQAAKELAEYASYAEIVGGLTVNRPQVREWCDKVFSAIRALPEDEDFERSFAALSNNGRGK